MDLLGIGMFPPPPFNNVEVLDKHEYWTTNRIEDNFCDPSITGLLFGFDQEQCNKTLMETYKSSTSSVRTIVQFGQEIMSGKLKMIFNFVIFFIKIKTYKIKICYYIKY